MKYIYTIIFAAFLALNGQTLEQIKKQLKDASISPDQAKQIAKDRGMTDQQIEAEAQARGINLDEAGDGSTSQQTTDPQIEPVLDESAVLESLESETTAEEELVLESTALANYTLAWVSLIRELKRMAFMQISITRF